MQTLTLVHLLRAVDQALVTYCEAAVDADLGHRSGVDDLLMLWRVDRASDEGELDGEPDDVMAELIRRKVAAHHGDDRGFVDDAFADEVWGRLAANGYIKDWSKS